MKKTRNTAGGVVLRVLFTLLLLGTIGLIFYQSSRIGEVSSGLSLRVTDKLNAWLGGAGLGIQVSHFTVRKLAHLAEYILLGFWAMLTLRVYTGRVLAFLSWPLLFGLSLAVGDEFLQQYIPGRTSSVTDVAIDFAGVLVGVFVALLLIMLVSAVARAFSPKKRRG